MTAPHAALTAAEVITRGGWHPRYARVAAIASEGDYGFALAGGNGGGTGLEAGHWLWHDGSWQPGGPSGVGPPGAAGLLRSGGEADETAWFAYGSAPGQDTVTIAFDGRSHRVPVSGYGVRALAGIRADPGERDEPGLVSWPGARISRL